MSYTFKFKFLKTIINKTVYFNLICLILKMSDLVYIDNNYKLCNILFIYPNCVKLFKI